MSDPNREIALHLPNDVAIGGALITMVEPNLGHDHAYNRWYEDDHFYSGAMQGPWTFAGRRFVATRVLRSKRAEVHLYTHHAALAASGLGELRFSGPFVPTHVGTDDDVDHLR